MDEGVLQRRGMNWDEGPSFLPSAVARDALFGGRPFTVSIYPSMSHEVPSALSQCVRSRRVNSHNHHVPFSQTYTRLGTNHFRNTSVILSRSRARPIVLVNVTRGVFFRLQEEDSIRIFRFHQEDHLAFVVFEIHPAKRLSVDLSIPRSIFIFYSKPNNYSFPCRIILSSLSTVETKARSGGNLDSRNKRNTGIFFLRRS